VPAFSLAAGGRWRSRLSRWLAVPAGYPDANKGEPLPIWLGLAVVSPVAVILVALGAAAAWGFRQRRLG
jgi:hypothetical protein